MLKDTREVASGVTWFRAPHEGMIEWSIREERRQRRRMFIEIRKDGYRTFFEVDGRTIQHFADALAFVGQGVGNGDDDDDASGGVVRDIALALLLLVPLSPLTLLT